MKNILLPLITAFLFVSTASFAGEDEAMLDRPSFSASQTVTTSAVVTAINKETRIVTLQQNDGEEITFTAGDEVRNLDQVSVGDVLIAEYVETISIEVMANEGMEAAAAGAAAMARTEKGEMPGFVAMDATVVTATVEEINLEKNTFKLKQVDGTINEYAARNPDNLRRAKVGDLVVTTVSTAVAIAVEKQAVE
jgi:hypothetical protein